MHLHIRKKGGETLSRLPREVTAAPSLDTIQVRLDDTLSNLTAGGWTR